MVRNYLKFEMDKKHYVIYLVILFALLSYGLMFTLDRQGNRSMISYISLLEQSNNANELEMAEALRKQDYPTFLKHRIQMKEEQRKTYTKDEDIYVYENEIAFDTYLLEHHIQPLNVALGVGFDQITSVNGASALLMSIRILLPILLPFLAFLLMINSIKDQKKAYNYTMTLPLKRKDIIKAKWVTSIGMGCIAILLFLLITFVIGVTFGGMGDFTYPLVLHASFIEQMQVQTYLPLWGFLLLSVFLSCIQIIVYVSIGMLLCKLVKHHWVQYLLLVVYIFFITKYLVSLPIHQMAPISLLTFLLGGPYYLVIQGYPIFLLTIYVIVCIIISSMMYLIYMSKQAKKDYFNETY